MNQLTIGDYFDFLLPWFSNYVLIKIINSKIQFELKSNNPIFLIELIQTKIN